jgi:hypothetical protein
MGLKKHIGAVLTGDIVNSTKLLPEQETRLIDVLNQVLKAQTDLHEFYRGDSFQAYLSRPADALHVALVCRGMAIQIQGEKEDIPRIGFDIRISIGVGEVPEKIDSLGTTKSEAFLNSGRQFEELREREQNLAIISTEPMANVGFQVIADYLDSIFKSMTVRQADVIVHLLQGITQQQLAITQSKSKSTISELAAAGRWSEIERLLQQYEKLINLSL